MYLLFYGSAHLGYALMIIFCLLSIGATAILFQFVGLLDVTNMDTERQVMCHFGAFIIGVLAGYVIYRWVRDKPNVPRLTAQFAIIEASVMITYFIIGPIPLPNTIKLFLTIFITCFGVHAFKHFEKISVTFGTAVIGAGNLLISIACYFGNLPNLISMANTKFGGLTEIGPWYVAYPLSLTLLTLLGFFYQ